MPYIETTSARSLKPVSFTLFLTLLFSSSSFLPSFLSSFLPSYPFFILISLRFLLVRLPFKKNSMATVAYFYSRLR